MEWSSSGIRRGSKRHPVWPFAPVCSTAGAASPSPIASTELGVAWKATPKILRLRSPPARSAQDDNLRAPIAHRPSPIAHRSSPIAHRPSPIASAGLPDDKIVELCLREEPEILGLSASMSRGIAQAVAFAAKVETLPHPPRVVLGGLAARLPATDALARALTAADLVKYLAV